ncbi:hypothetical protein DMC14_000325 [Metamycoplasma phocicerebrale]|uniref:Uncharacterized protein n=1 Tax=Metamycoplasma phocicerebrale TaxID=142649 RepID=A0A3Q9V2Q8_9BACT|nr:hypothetical protein [Metamycoplasma phocicerebrale]AZZ65255.1 hypothetical protein DMC14_000325 [Metamycoplasma phocicerebrale]
MILSRLGKNYVLKAKTLDYALDPRTNKKIDLVKIVEEKNDLVLFFSDNLSFGEIASCILGMFGFQDYVNIPWFNLDNKIVCRDWINKERNNIILDSPIYPYLNYEIKMNKSFILSVILVDFSIISFEIEIQEIKNTNFIDFKVDGIELKSATLMALKKFKTTYNDEWLIDNQAMTAKIGKELSQILDKKLFKLISEEERAPLFSTVSWPSGEYLDLLERPDLCSIPQNLEIFETRKHPEEVEMVKYLEEDEEKENNSDNNLEEFDPTIDDVYKLLNMDIVKQENPILNQMSPEELIEFAKKFKEQFKGIEKSQREFLKKIVVMAKEQGLTMEEVKEILKEHLTEFYKEAKAAGANLGEQDAEQILSAMLEVYDEELNNYEKKQSNNKSKKNKKLDKEDDGEIN